MGACLWAAYRRNAQTSVPAPVDADTPDAPWWYDHVAAQCDQWARAGYTAVMLPPVQKAEGGSGRGCDGYGCFDDYDIGSKNQQGGVPTRFGDRDRLLRLCAIAAACGLDVYLDMVPHQRIGAANGTYRYVGADGRTLNGRFPKDRGMFCSGPVSDGWAPHDPVAGNPDFGFGDEISRVYHTPPTPAGYAQQQLIAAGDWVIRTTGAEGCRIDDTKGQNAGMVRDWCNSAAMAGKYMVGEFADGNADNLNAWVWNSIFDAWRPGTEGRCAAFDFDAHYNKIKAMCENAGRFDMRGLRGGFLNASPTMAATFVENPDTDTNGFAQVAFNKMAGYFLIMTMQGYPFVYYKDRSHDAGCYGLADEIDNCAWLQRMIIGGAQVERYADHDLYAYERQGAHRVLCAINNAPGGWRQQWMPTGFGANVRLHDYTGHADDVWTDADGWVNLGVPPNDNGLGYVAYATEGLGVPVPVWGRAITQTTFGADDLDVGPLVPGRFTRVRRAWCERGTDLTAHLRLVGGNRGSATIAFSGPDNQVMHRATAFDGHCVTQERGWHTIDAMWVPPATIDPSASVAYEMDVTYTAPRTL